MNGDEMRKVYVWDTVDCSMSDVGNLKSDTLDDFVLDSVLEGNQSWFKKGRFEYYDVGTGPLQDFYDELLEEEAKA